MYNFEGSSTKFYFLHKLHCSNSVNITQRTAFIHLIVALIETLLYMSVARMFLPLQPSSRCWDTVGCHAHKTGQVEGVLLYTLKHSIEDVLPSAGTMQWCNGTSWKNSSWTWRAAVTPWMKIASWVVSITSLLSSRAREKALKFEQQVLVSRSRCLTSPQCDDKQCRVKGSHFQRQNAFQDRGNLSQQWCTPW